MRTALLAALTTVILLPAAGCSMRPAQGGSATRNIVTGDQLVATNTRTVYEALERLRPAWMSSRGPVSIGSDGDRVSDSGTARANVYVNGARAGDLDYLRQIAVMDVEQVQFYAAGEAGARFGMGNPRGVIAITTRR